VLRVAGAEELLNKPTLFPGQINQTNIASSVLYISLVWFIGVVLIFLYSLVSSVSVKRSAV